MIQEGLDIGAPARVYRSIDGIIVPAQLGELLDANTGGRSRGGVAFQHAAQGEHLVDIID